ncbi:MAG TPA: hypothetical protein VGP72_32690 [Planctomycetota bacterium]|jgi:hypothetical protein
MAEESWSDAMLAAAERYALPGAGGPRKLMPDGVQCLAWQRITDPKHGMLPAPDGTPAAKAVFPPEQMGALAAFDWEYAPRSWGADEQPTKEGEVRSLPAPPGQQRQYAFFAARQINSDQDRAVEVWVWSDCCTRVFLNGEAASPVMPAATAEAAAAQQKVSLKLRKGGNLLLVKFAPVKPKSRCYVSFAPALPEMDDAATVAAIANGLHTEFPAAMASFMNIWGYDLGGWLKRKESAAFVWKLKEKLGGAREEPYVSFLRRLEKTDPADAAAVLRLFEGFVKQVCAANAAGLPPIAFIKRTGYGMNGTNGTMFSHRTHRGSTVCVFEPNTQTDSKLFETKEGFIWDLAPAFDASKLLLSYKEKGDQPFSVWEMSARGSAPKRLTSGPYHDFNPVYYPDGRIVFCSSRARSFSMCQDFLASALHVMNGDGTNLRRFDFTTLCSNAPAVMPDGSIICTRWEYQDKNIFMWQGLWTINPDGRQLKLYYGNTITVPNSRYGAKPIPGTGKVLLTMAPHHHPPLGDIAVVDRDLGVENAAAMTQVTHGTSYQVLQGRNWRDTNWGSGDGQFGEAYVDPMPIDSRRFLVSYSGCNGPLRHRIFILDYYGIGGPIIEDPALSCFSPVPLASRPVPAAIKGEVPVENGEATFFVQDVYQGLLEQGVQRGQVKELRVMKVLPKKYNTEGPRYHDHYPVIGYGSYYVKENLGSAPVEEDGSAYFKAPSNCELYFIAVDASGKEIQRMGSVTQAITGEWVSCVGCHDRRASAPPVASASTPARLQRPADALKPPPWGAGPIDYVRHVQPVFDAYCVKCHSGRAPPLNNDLSGDKSRLFNMSYDNLIERGMVEYYYINPGPSGEFPALKTGSYVSRLTQLIESGHKGRVQMDDESRKRIYTWIDSNCQYYATWDMSRPHTMGGRDTWSFCEDDKHVPPRLEPWALRLERIYNQSGCQGCHGEMTAASGRAGTRVNLTRPEFSRMLNAHLSKAAGGMELSGQKQDRTAPVWKDSSDPTYKTMLECIQEGKAALDARPRMDMPGGKAVPQERNFGKVF